MELQYILDAERHMKEVLADPNSLFRKIAAYKEATDKRLEDWSGQTLEVYADTIFAAMATLGIYGDPNYFTLEDRGNRFFLRSEALGPQTPIWNLSKKQAMGIVNLVARESAIIADIDEYLRDTRYMLDNWPRNKTLAYSLVMEKLLRDQESFLPSHHHAIQSRINLLNAKGIYQNE